MQYKPTYPPMGSRASANNSTSRKIAVLIPISHVTARVNGGTLKLLGSPVRRTDGPLSNSTRLGAPHFWLILPEVGIWVAATARASAPPPGCDVQPRPPPAPQKALCPPKSAEWPALPRRISAHPPPPGWSSPATALHRK